MTGAHLRAESGDRPLAYHLRETMLDWRDDNCPDGPLFDVLVISDVWYLNNEELQNLPVVSVGGPGVNALTANLADKVPTAFVIEDTLMVQVDLDFHDRRVACWGMNHAQGARAIQAFVERYLDGFLSDVAKRIERDQF